MVCAQLAHERGAKRRPERHQNPDVPARDVVLLQQLAHLFRTRRFFIGGGRFGIRRVRLLVCFGSGMSGRDIARRACRLGMLRRSERNILFGRTLYG